MTTHEVSKSGAAGLVTLVEVDDFAQADRLAEFLEAGGVEVFARSTQDLGGILGTPGSSYVLEVAQSSEVEARRLLESFRANAALDAEKSDEGASPTRTPASVTNVGAHRRAATMTLVFSVVAVAIGALVGKANPVVVYGAAVFDFLIWRRFSDPELTLASARRVRLFALLRVGTGAVMTFVLAMGGLGAIAWMQFVVLVFVGVLYSQPLEVASSDEPEPLTPPVA